MIMGLNKQKTDPDKAGPGTRRKTCCPTNLKYKHVKQKKLVTALTSFKQVELIQKQSLVMRWAIVNE